MRRQIREAAAELGALEQEVSAWSALVEGRLLSLQQKVQGRLGPFSAELGAMVTRLTTARATLEADAGRTRGELAARGAAAGARVDAIVKEGKGALDGVEGSVQGGAAAVKQAEAAAQTALGTAQEAAQGALTPLKALKAQLAAGRQGLSSLEKTLAQLEATFEAALATLEGTVLAGITAIQQALAQAIEIARSTLDIVLEEVTAFTGGISRAMDEVEIKLSEIQDKGEALVATLLSLLDKAMGIIDKIPVDMLPEMMVQPTKTLLTQALTQFGTAIATGAKTARTQLETVATQISTQIEKVQTEVGKKVEEAKKKLLEKVDQVIQTVQQKAQEMASKIDEMLSGLEAQVTAQEEALRTQIEALANGTLAPIVALVAKGRETLAGLRGALDERLAALEAGVDTALARPGQELGRVRGEVERGLAAALQGARQKLAALPRA